MSMVAFAPPRHRGAIRLVSTRGAPMFLRSDNGPEFVSKALLSWIAGKASSRR
jgi:hypothetical protein